MKDTWQRFSVVDGDDHDNDNDYERNIVNVPGCKTDMELGCLLSMALCEARSTSGGRQSCTHSCYYTGPSPSSEHSQPGRAGHREEDLFSSLFSLLCILHLSFTRLMTKSSPSSMVVVLSNGLTFAPE